MSGVRKFEEFIGNKKEMGGQNGKIEKKEKENEK